jgi:hypothetical protein
VAGTRESSSPSGTRPPGALLCAALLLLPRPSSAANARGSVVYGARTAPIAHAYLIHGPDAVDPKKKLRRLVLSTAEIGPKVAGCSTMACVDDALADGVEIDFDAGPRLNYWLVLEAKKVQYSGTADPAAFAAKRNDGRRIAGRISIDDSGAGGPKIDATFDAPIAKEIDRVR